MREKYGYSMEKMVQVEKDLQIKILTKGCPKDLKYLHRSRKVPINFTTRL